jgi:hypothetical protein
MYLDAMHSSFWPNILNAGSKLGKLSPLCDFEMNDDDDSESDGDWKLELEFLWPRRLSE